MTKKCIWVVDGPIPENKNKILKIFQDHKADYTFFVCDAYNKRLWRDFLFHSESLDLPVNGVLDELATELRDQYISYVDALKEHKAFRDSCGNAFLIDGKVSNWWLHEYSMHPGNAFNAFLRYIQISLLQRYIKQNDIGEIVVVSKDGRFVDALRASFSGMKVTILGRRSRLQSLRVQIAVLEQFVRQTAWGVQALLMSALCKLTIPKKNKEPKGIDWGFYSQFPDLWKGTGLKEDDKYRGLPAEKRALGQTSIFLLSMTSDGFHQKMTLSKLRPILRHNKSVIAQNVVLDHFLSWRDGISFFLQAYLSIKRGMRIDSALKRYPHKDKNQIDITPYLILQNYRSTLRVPRALLEGQKAKNAVEYHGIRNFVFYLYEFILGRCVLYKVKQAKTPLKTIGMQHAPINSRMMRNLHDPKLLGYSPNQDYVSHMPHPDEIWIEDEEAEKNLVASGYPRNVLKIISPLRMVQANSNQKPQIGSSDVVFVYPTISEDKTLFYTLLPFLEKKPEGIEVYFKPHPRSTFSANDIQSWIAKYALKNVKVFKGSMAEALSLTTLGLATDSSAVEEVLAEGKQVALILVPNKYNQSVLYLDQRVKKIREAEELFSLVRRDVDLPNKQVG